MVNQNHDGIERIDRATLCRNPERQNMGIHRLENLQICNISDFKYTTLGSGLRVGNFKRRKTHKSADFEVVKAVTIKRTIFRVVTPCSSLEIH